ncbi:MAG TPA: rhomboid family intramembrane serine protease [Flavisolibacter sp.]|jgi:membrane associated rhomboid family serine protease|nr:rhomboid family intramembrane serine protease [Flavisolibacter sp.]
MSYYQQRNRTRLSIGEDGNTLTLLLIINLIVFAVLAFIKVIYYFSFSDKGVMLFNEQIFKWFTLPADLGTFITRPWTLITHMFVHDTASIWHILGNMVWLWTFGYILQGLAGNKKLIPLYIYGGLAGAVAYMLAYNFLSPLKVDLAQSQAFGASAAVMCIAIGTTTLAPGYRIFPMLNGGIPLWVITVIYLIIDLATIPYNNPGGHIAHIAGAGMGYLFVVALQRGSDWGAWINTFFDWVNNLFNPDVPKKGNSPKTTLYYNAKVQPYKKANIITQQRIDELLDKISQKGYHSLNEDEKDMLKRASKEDLL